MIETTTRTPRVFLLSPANCNGTRGAQVLSPRANSETARQLRSTEGIPIGELFSFVSGLYFRGKLNYARHFAVPPEVDNPVIGSGVHIITTNAGLRSPETRVTRTAIRRFAAE